VTWCPDAPEFVVAPLGWNSALWQRYDPDYGREVIVPCSKLMVHHTASNAPPAGGEAAFTRQIEAYGESRDGAAVEYHYLIYPSGVMHGGFGDTRGCHSAQTDPSAGVNYNSTAIGVSFVGYFHPPYHHQPTAAAVATFQAWLAWMIDSARLSDDVLEQSSWNGDVGWYGHRDVFATACPGDVLYPQLPTIVALPAQPSAPLGPELEPPEEDHMAVYLVAHPTSGAWFASDLATFKTYVHHPSLGAEGAALFGWRTADGAGSPFMLGAGWGEFLDELDTRAP
jgi:hypothetical protein